MLSREQLLAEVWDWADASGTRTVDSHIKALRRKIGAERIRTVHGVGYALETRRLAMDRSARLGPASPFSIKAKLGALVVVSVLITTGLLMIAVRTKTELRFITVFSVIATLLITQFVAHGLTAPLDEMNTVARSISHGDYTRRVAARTAGTSSATWRETINRMADELEAQDRQRKELVANVSHELRTPIARAARRAGERRRRRRPRPTRRRCARR